ncbi:MAG: epoxyqueuosine reductase QueH, partial [Selenomonadaceae bacterium]|nr:epoxyqueuosine reductase QueH [Selenomonadaceae bacterium]
MCCGPCSCYPTRRLREEGFEPVGYFFNPNIHPHQEWRRRLQTARSFAEAVGMKFFADNHYGLREY